MDVIFRSSVLCWNEKFSWWEVRTIPIFVYLMLRASKWERICDICLSGTGLLYSVWSFPVPIIYLKFSWSHFHYSFISWMTLGCFHFIAIVNKQKWTWLNKYLRSKMSSPLGICKGVVRWSLALRGALQPRWENFHLNYIWIFMHWLTYIY